MIMILLMLCSFGMGSIAENTGRRIVAQRVRLTGSGPLCDDEGVIPYRSRWLTALALGAVCAGLALWGVMRYRARRVDSPRDMVARVPTRDAVLTYIDFAALRKAGLLDLLARSGVAQEAEYRDFVAGTGFDYARDLDSVLVSFAPTGKYFIVKGRFDWDKLRAYALRQKGACGEPVCRMSGSTAERNISFYRLDSQTMALAVSRDDSAALRITRESAGGDSGIPVSGDPLWLYVPGHVLKTAESLPEGTHMFARSMQNAEDIVLALGPQAQAFAVKLDLRCRSDREAAAIAESLGQATGKLRDLIARENQQPNPRDLSGVLASGAFRSEGPRVVGRWTIERVFFEEFLAGKG